MARESGVLLPVFSLPGPYGIGCFSAHAHRWIDFLAAAGQSYWQILPLGPTGYGDSPYQSFSTFAGNPYFIDPEALIDQGLLSPASFSMDGNSANSGENANPEKNANPAKSANPEKNADSAPIDYKALYETRYPLLRRAFENAAPDSDPDYRRFCADNAFWLDDYALFMALKGHFDGKPWTEWPVNIRLRRADAPERYRTELSAEIAFQKWMQWMFFRPAGVRA